MSLGDDDDRGSGKFRLCSSVRVTPRDKNIMESDGNDCDISVEKKNKRKRKKANNFPRLFLPIPQEFKSEASWPDGFFGTSPFHYLIDSISSEDDEYIDNFKKQSKVHPYKNKVYKCFTRRKLRIWKPCEDSSVGYSCDSASGKVSSHRDEEERQEIFFKPVKTEEGENVVKSEIYIKKEHFENI